MELSCRLLSAKRGCLFAFEKNIYPCWFIMYIHHCTTIHRDDRVKIKLF